MPFALLHISSLVAATDNNFREFRIASSDWSNKTKEEFPAFSEGGCAVACYKIPECRVARYHGRTCSIATELTTARVMDLPVAGQLYDMVTALVRKEEYSTGRLT